MSLVEAVKSGWKCTRKANSRISTFPKFFVEGMINRYNKAHEIYLRKKLAKVDGDITVPNLIVPLIDNLRKYTQSEVAEATHRIEFNEALLGSDETRELYIPDLPNIPENKSGNWVKLGQNLAQLSQYFGNLRFNTKTRQFYLTIDVGSDLGNLVKEVNEQLKHAKDLSIIVDQNYTDNALADRSDFGVRKLVRPLIGKYSNEFRQIIQNGFVIVGPKNISFYMPPNSQGKFPLFVESFVNPTL